MTKLQNEDRKRDLVMRLKRAEGQLRGIQAMIENGADCEQIAQQMTATRKALDKTFFQMVACVIEQAAEGDERASAKTARKMEQVATMLARFA
jgi:DNA-binding FrmR family transcriptional regulator